MIAYYICLCLTISLSIMPLKFICVVANGRISFFLMAEYCIVCMCIYMCVCVSHNFFIHSSVNGHLECFYILAVVNNSAKNCCCCCLVTKLCLTLCDPMNCSMPGCCPNYLPESAQTRVHWVSDAIQPSHPLSPSSPPALNLSQYQGLFQWVSSSHQVAKVLELRLGGGSILDLPTPHRQTNQGLGGAGGIIPVRQYRAPHWALSISTNLFHIGFLKNILNMGSFPFSH